MVNALQTYFEKERGRAVRLASALGITPGAISQWDRVPIERVAEVEQLTGIPRKQLRPDIFATHSPSPKKQVARHIEIENQNTLGEGSKRKSVIGCMKGMVTLPPDFNPAEPFWTTDEEWDSYAIGGLDNS